MKRIISILLIVVAVLIFAYYLAVVRTPQLDAMYLPEDKYGQKEKIGDQDENTGVRGLRRVNQGENGIYFVYKDRLMVMGDADESVKEVCKMSGDIIGILEKDNTVFLRKYDDVEGIYKVDAEGEAQRLINDPGTVYMEGKNIYTSSKKNGLRKYDFNGKKISENNKDDYYDTNITIFDNYILFKLVESNDIWLNSPQYYKYDANKIKYVPNKINFSKYYLEPEAWDRYSSEKVISYDLLSKEVDRAVREGEINAGTTEKNLDDYELQSIELFPWYFSEVTDGYIYIYGNQKITYLDKEYKRKSEEMTLEEQDDNREKFTCKISVKAVFRISVDDIKNSSNETYVNYERVGKSPNIPGDWSRFIVNKNNVYVINEDEYTDKESYRNLYIYSIDVDTGLNKEVYKKKRFFLGNDSPEIFATDEYIFIYEYGDYGEKQCITRINRDGSNPILVMDENGEVVMKPVQ